MGKIAITGSSGFIGQHLCRRLATGSNELFGIDINPPSFEHPNSVETVQHDIAESADLPDVDVIVHLAAHSQVQPLVDKPELAIKNIEMVKSVLEVARKSDASVVNISSRDVYGSAMQPSEKTVNTECQNNYAASKLGGEALVNAYRNSYDITATSLRFANVYGPMDTNPRVIPIFIALAAVGRELTVYGSNKILDFVHVSDVCRAIDSTIQRLDAVDGEAINIGSGTGTPLPHVAEAIDTNISDCQGWTEATNRTGDVGRYVSDISKAQGLIGYEPEVSFADGIEKTVEWYLDHPSVLKGIRIRLESGSD